MALPIVRGPNRVWTRVCARLSTVAVLLIATTGLGELRAQRPILDYRFQTGHMEGGAFTPVVGDLKVSAEGEMIFASDTLLISEASRPLISEPFDPTDVLTDRAFSIEAVVSVDDFGPNRPILSMWADVDGQRRGFCLMAHNNRLTFGLRTTKSDQPTFVESNRLLERNRYVLATATYDGRRMRLYQDGALVGTSKDQSGRVAYYDTQRLSIGEFEVPIEGERFKGAIHSCRIFDRVLSQTNVERRLNLPDGLPDPATRRLAWLGFSKSDAPMQTLIDLAIDQGVEHLLEEQRDNGRFPSHESYRNGATALATLALLHCGVARDDPAILKALEFLAEQAPVTTYAAGVELLMLQTLDSPARRRMAEDSLQALLDFEQDGEWAYPHNHADLSNTQFAALGFWAAEQMGLEIDDRVYDRMIDRLIDDYRGNPDKGEVGSPSNNSVTERRIRGFGYYPRRSGTRATMTLAALCVMAIATECGGLNQPRKTKVREATEQALDWFAARFPPRDSLYGLYGQERVGALYETDFFGSNEWYPHGARRLVGDQNSNGSWGDVAETSFALLFLSRATRNQVHGPLTGESSGTVWNLAEGPVRLRAAGREPTSIFLVGFDDETTAKQPRVLHVAWTIDGEVSQNFESDGGGVWRGAPYAFQSPLDLRTAHEVTATVRFLGNDGQEHTVTSQAMVVGGPSRDR
ncbi:MAG: LamG-like jellyroll fold domain-containing protein [Planctomycetota bacterium]